MLVRDDGGRRCRRVVGAVVVAATVGAAGCTGSSSAVVQRPDPARGAGPDFSDVRARVQELVGQGLPSIAIAVVIDGDIVWEEGFGVEDVDTRQPATPHTRYPIGSVSKPFAATAVMILAERGEIDLSAPANRYLGPARLRRHDGDSDDVTVRDLLQHRGGLPSPHVSRYYRDDLRPSPPPVEETIRRYALVIDPPGQRFAYSNLGYGILAHMVSRVAGASYADFLERELFGPLELRDTTLEVNAAPSQPTAALYSGGRPVPAYRFDEEGSGRIWSSVHDLARFALFHLGEQQPDQRLVLGERARLAMASDTRPYRNDGGAWATDRFYGLGWGGREQGTFNAYRWYGHDGGLPGALAELRLVPDQRLAIAILSNDDTAPTKAILELVLDAVMPGHTWARREDPAMRPRPERRPFAATAAFLGTWTGEVHTWSESISIHLEIERRRARARLGGGALLVLDGLEIVDGRLRGHSLGHLPAPDLGGLPYELWYELRPDRDRLVGAVYAVDTARLRHFVLPSWTSLERRIPLDWGPRPEGVSE